MEATMGAFRRREVRLLTRMEGAWAAAKRGTVGGRVAHSTDGNGQRDGGLREGRVCAVGETAAGGGGIGVRLWGLGLAV